MDGYGGRGNIHDSSKLQDPTPFGANPTGNNAVFDASQYEFFGGDVVDEVELGGLEDEEDDLAPAGFEEEEFHLDKEEHSNLVGDVLAPLSDIDDISSTFSKLNQVAGGPTSAGSRDEGSRESSYVYELAQDLDFNSAYDAKTIYESKKWSSHPYSSAARFAEPISLHKTTSYSEHPQQPQNICHQHSGEPILVPNSTFTSYPHIQASDLSSFSNSRLQLNSSPHGSQFGGSFPQLPHGVPVSGQIQNQRVNHQSNLYPGNHSGFPNNFSPYQNGLRPQQMMPPQQTGVRHPLQPSIGHLQAHSINPHLSPPQSNFNMLGLPDLRDQRVTLLSRSRPPMTRYPHQGSDSPRFRSKYMTVAEVENIHRQQLAATHSNDPYVEDYYHQAILARKSASAKLRHHFCPTDLRDGSSKPRVSNEPHPFLQVDALGRVSFSSIRRPRPLLEIDSLKSSSNGDAELKILEKPLEQEPMLAARVAIEDGLYLLLDVDDIDRFLQFNPLSDGGVQLRQRRQVLLEGLASSLQLVDPLGKNGHTENLAPKDDSVFLRLVSLPKGKKLLLRYLEVLWPGELCRVVCMAICRNLGFLFGNPPSDHECSAITSNLAKTVSSCVHHMELKSLAACLASVVCSAEHPPLRPTGHVAGDGASVILKSVLERATELLTDPRAAENCSPHHRAFWQASFDAFFGVLTKYCFSKYDYVLQSFTSQGSVDMAGIGSDVAKAISREVPVELLRASLPHTSEQQRKLLLEFAQRTMPVTGFSGSS
ncbi:hypothetical protein OROGR_007174 [Orobanche gracilis]